MSVLKKIPDQVILVSRTQETERNLDGQNENVFSTYAVDSTNTKRLEAARAWGDQRSIYSTVKGQGTETDAIPNEGFKLRILNLEVRAQGGRAYKVIDQNQRMYDLREDTLLEVIKTVGIQPNGVLPGEYLFSLQGSEMKLIRSGSETHKQLLSASTNEARRAVTKPVLGMTYRTGRMDANQFVIFLGVLDGKQVWTDVTDHAHKPDGEQFHLGLFLDIVNKRTVYAAEYPSCPVARMNHLQVLNWCREITVKELAARDGWGMDFHKYYRTRLEQLDKLISSYS